MTGLQNYLCFSLIFQLQIILDNRRKSDTSTNIWAMLKHVLCHERTIKAQISLHIRTV